MKILGAVLELLQLKSTANPVYLKTVPNWPNQRCCLAGSSKTVPRILIFSIVMCAKYLSYVKSIATFALKFYSYIISVLASVYSLRLHGCGNTFAIRPFWGTFKQNGNWYVVVRIYW